MTKNEQTSPQLAKLASNILSGVKKPTEADAKRLAGALLNQAPNKPAPKKK